MILLKKSSSNKNRLTHIATKYKRNSMVPFMPTQHSDIIRSNGSSKSSLSSGVKFTPGSFKMGENEHISFKQRKRRHSRLTFEKSKNIDYSEGPLIEFVVKEEDAFSANIILQSFKFINILIQNISSNINLQLAVAQSGILWQILIFLMKDNANWSLKFILDPVVIEKINLTTLKYFFSN